MNKRSTGFGAIEILLVIIVVGVLGATGWYALHTKHQTDQILAQSAKTSQSIPRQNSSVNSYNECIKAPGSKELEAYPPICVTKNGEKFTDTVSLTNPDYLVVNEWGVRFKTDTLTIDAEYLINDDHSLYLTTARYAALGRNCGLTGDIGYLVRGPAGYLINPGGVPIEKMSVSYKDNNGNTITDASKKVGNYYYWWEGPQAPCTNPSNSVASDYQAAITAMAKTVEANPNL